MLAWLPLAPAASPLRPLPRPHSVPLGGGGLWSHLREAPLGRALGGPRPWPLLAATGREGGGPHFQGPVFMPGASHQARGFRVRLSLVVTTLCEVGTCVLQQEKAEVQRGAVTTQAQITGVSGAAQAYWASKSRLLPTAQAPRGCGVSNGVCGHVPRREPTFAGSREGDRVGLFWGRAQNFCRGHRPCELQGRTRTPSRTVGTSSAF